jgi:hypothetical protein
MRKATLFLFAVTLAAGTLGTGKSMAQGSQNHIFHVNTTYQVIGLDSAERAERTAILKEYHEKVTMKNPYVLHVWTMTHYYSDDSREFVTVYEFAKWEDIDKANEKDGELEKQAWPDAKQRQAFMKKMNSYFTYHKDAIYHGIPEVMK